ncbi:MAG: glycoside hydrolase family 3 protein [Steroidobacter sp.]
MPTRSPLATVSATLCMLALGGCSPDRDSGASSSGRPATSPAEAVDWPRVTNDVREDPGMEARIASLLSRMTLEQKVAQMVQAEIRDVTPQDVRVHRLGSILNGGGAFPGDDKHAAVADWVALADQFYDASMDTSGGAPAIPIIWGVDAVHGHNNVIGATLFPHNIGLGATRNADLIERIGEITAREVAVTGIDWTFAPTLAVVRDDRWGRTYEGYSEDPEIVRAFAGRMVRGLQGAAGTAGFLDANRVVATAKHFIGDGGTQRGVDRGDTLASEQELLSIHAQGYLTALAEGVQTVMASYNSWNGWKVHGQEYLLSDVLKTQLGFDGIVVSDWDGVDEVQGCSKDKCAPAVNAGIDLFMVPTQWKTFLENTIAQVRSGEVPQARIDDAVTRILRVKLRAGLFGKGRPSTRPLANKRDLLGAVEHRAVARQAVRESLVLLKNDKTLLPLRRDLNVLVAGDGADNIGKQAGGWSITWQGTGNVNADFPGATSIFAGIRNAVNAAGGSATLSVDGSYAARPDVAIVVFGEEPYAEWLGNVLSIDYQGEGGTDLALLRRFKEARIPIVAIFLTGRPLWIAPELDASDAFVVAWLPGSEGGGLADVLFRDENGAVNHDFVGRLSFSWPRRADQSALNRNDPDYDARFAYGFGLDYASNRAAARHLSMAVGSHR